MVLTSCRTSFEFKGLLSYYNQTKALAPELMKKPSKDICHLIHEDKPIVYVVNAHQLKECLTNIDNAIIYEWSANCKSSVCIPLNLAQSFAEKNNLELFVVAEYYDLNAMNRMYTLKRPIFGKDIDFYSTNFTHRYNYMFYTELFGFSLETETGRFHYVEKGEWKASYHSLNDYLASNSNLIE